MNATDRPAVPHSLATPAAPAAPALARRGPVELLPHQLTQVAGGSPKGGWPCTTTTVESPKGGWA
jgi:hypothetical protein